MKKPSARELRLGQAQELLANIPDGGLKSYEAQSEVAKYLRETLRISRDDVASILGLSKRQVMTRLHTFKQYALEGKIPSAELKALGVHLTLDETPEEAVVMDEIEKLNRSSSTKFTSILMKKDVLEQRLIAAIAPRLATPADIQAVESLYREVSKTRVKGKKREQVALANMSDLHVYQNNVYHKTEDSLKANETYVRKVLELTHLQRLQGYPVSKLRLNVFGDNLNGTANFPHQKWDVDRAAVDQAEGLTGILVKNIETYLVDFDEVIVNLVWGNHAKIIQNNVDPLHSNWEVIAARSLRWAFRNNPRVKFNIAETWWMIDDVLGTKVLITHGDAIKGSGTMDGLIQAYRKWANTLPHFDIALQGHIHRFARLPLPRTVGSTKHKTIYVNGTAVKDDEHTLTFGSSPSNQWWILFVNEKRGVTVEYAADLYD